MTVDIELLKQIKFIKCKMVPDLGGPDDGLRVYVTQALPLYLQVKEILEGSALNLVIAADGRADWEADQLFRFLVPCENECESLGDQIREGCNAMHWAAHSPGSNVAELVRGGAPILIAEKTFSGKSLLPEIRIYSDGSVLHLGYPAVPGPPSAEAFGGIPAFIRKHAENMAGSPAGSAMAGFRIYCAEQHVDAYFEAFLPR
jgi:hypothetical protein